MSWRERYKKNEAWFDWAVYRHQRDEDFDEPPPRGILKPKTGDAPPPVSVKRRRVSDAQEEAPPKKKTRVQEQPEPGPSRRAGQAGPSSSHARTKAAKMPAEEEEEERMAIRGGKRSGEGTEVVPTPGLLNHPNLSLSFSVVFKIKPPTI